MQSVISAKNNILLWVLAILAVALPTVLPAQSASSANDEGKWYGDLPNPDSLDFMSDFVKHLSKGWFPTPYKARSVGYTTTISFYQFDRAESFRSNSFTPTKYPFSAENPYEGDEVDIKKANSDEDAKNDFPSEGYSSMGLMLDYNLPIPCVLRASLCYDITRTRLYSVDTSRSFLALSGLPQPFKEVNVLFSNQHFLSAKVGMLLPFYGIFMETEAVQTSSYYYLYGGVSASGRILTEATQYVQIANAKDRIRFANGQDTLTTLNKAKLSTENTLRYDCDLALGWRFAVRGAVFFDLQAYASLPLNTVLSDARWMQYRIGLRLGIGYEKGLD